MKKWMTKTDAILFIVLLLLGLGTLTALHFQKPKPLVARVTVRGEEVLEISLDTLKSAQKIPLENGVVLLAEHNRICVCDADCKDKICVRTGWLSKNGDVAACLPNQTVVAVYSQTEATVDTVTY